jgi:2-C-methyl-D-erythritol 4-phosphate cytidylyltransferase
MAGLAGAEVLAVILAAGAGERMGDGEPKAFRELDGRSMLSRSAGSAAATPEVDALIVACPAGMGERAASEIATLGKTFAICVGGASRHASVRAAIAELPPSCRVVVCHDAARALVRPELFGAVLRRLASAPADVAAVIPAVPVADTIKRINGDEVAQTLARNDLRAAQTPQGFRARDLREAHRLAEDAGLEFTDDAAAIEWAGGRVLVIPGDADNLKITTERDLALAHALLAGTRRG